MGGAVSNPRRFDLDARLRKSLRYFLRLVRCFRICERCVRATGRRSSSSVVLVSAFTVSLCIRTGMRGRSGQRLWVIRNGSRNWLLGTTARRRIGRMRRMHKSRCLRWRNTNVSTSGKLCRSPMRYGVRFWVQNSKRWRRFNCILNPDFPDSLHKSMSLTYNGAA